MLFSISDRPAQEALGIWREGKLPPAAWFIDAPPKGGAFV